MSQIPVRHPKMCRVTMLYLAVCAVLSTGCSSLVHKFERMDLETTDFKPIPKEQSLVRDKDRINEARQESAPFLAIMPLTPVGVQCRVTIPELDELIIAKHEEAQKRAKQSLNPPVLSKELFHFKGILQRRANKSLLIEDKMALIEDAKLIQFIRDMVEIADSFSTMNHYYSYFIHRFKREATFSVYSDGENSTSVYNINGSYYHSFRLVLAVDPKNNTSHGWFEHDNFKLRSFSTVKLFDGVPYTQTQTLENSENPKIAYSVRVVSRVAEDDPTPKQVTIQKLGVEKYQMNLVFEDCRPLD